MIEKNKIFCADDLGKNKITNQRIINLARKRKIQKISIMLGKNYYLTSQETTFLKEKREKFSLDIHLTLNDYNASITYQKNTLARLGIFLFKIIFSFKNIEKDWQKQIDRFKKIFQKKPDGMNSHEHIHFFPPLFFLSLKLAQKNKIPHIRLGKKIEGKGGIYFVLMILQKIDYVIFFFFKKRWPKIRTNQNLTSFNWFKKIDFFENKIKKEKQIEVIFHPEEDSDFFYLLKDKN